MSHMSIPRRGRPAISGPGSHVTIGALLGAFFLIQAVMGLNFLLTLFAGAVAVLLTATLWTTPPALVFAAGLQFVAITTKLIQANLFGVSVNSLSELGGDIETAIWVSLAGLSALVIGMKLGLRLIPGRSVNLSEEVRQWTPWNAFLFCGAAMALQFVFEAASRLSGGLTQLLLAAGGVQWVGVFVLTYVCFVQNRGYHLLAIVVALEVAVGLLGIFSAFKEVFFVLIIAILAARVRFNLPVLISAALAALVLIVLSTYWTIIKPSYRSYLANSSPAIEEQYDFLTSAAGQVTLDSFGEGMKKLAARVSYVDFFAKAIEYVPAARPHEDGALLGAAISHVLFPRLIFSDKPPLEADTIITGRYTGIAAYQGPINASISLGFFAELYIDFGVVGMCVCLLLLGAAYGALFSFLLHDRAYSALINAGIAVMVALTFWQFERSLPKTVGAALTTFLVALVLRKYVFPHLLAKFGLLTHQKRNIPYPRPVQRSKFRPR